MKKYTILSNFALTALYLFLAPAVQACFDKSGALDLSLCSDESSCTSNGGSWEGAFCSIPSDSAQLTNISVRCPIGTGGVANNHNQVVAGFVISGTQPKKILLRAQDSALGDGVQEACLTLYELQGATPVQKDSNCFWKQHSSASEISSLSANLIPPNDTDAAMIVSLNPGVYTAEAYGNNFVGTASLEDLDADSVDSRLMNLSGRCLVEKSPRNAVVGFVVSGAASSNMNVLVRGMTSGLTQQPNVFDPSMDF